MVTTTPLLHSKPVSYTDLAAAYVQTRQASVALTSDLHPEDCVVQTMPEVSPTKWHLAHTTWFFEQFCLLDRLAGCRPFKEHYLYLFNSYYQSVGAMHARPKRGLLNRPLLTEVLDYRAHIDEAILGLMNDDADPGLRYLITLGLNHEQQHQELMLTDIKHVFFTNPLQPAYAAPRTALAGDALPLDFVDRPGGRFEIGHAGDGFGFDNETPRHALLVAPHQLGSRLVTNGEYRDFIVDGGYRDPRLWLADGFTRVQSEEWNRPLYWSDDLEREFTLTGWRDLDPASPVCHVSQYEADAFARWAGARLPTEAEWELAAAGSEIRGNTLDKGLLHPAAAGNRSAGPVHQLFGDVWEWTASPYISYPGFEPLAGSLGEYNGKFMSNQIVVRGGSCATWADHLRASYRSFFYPHDRWQFLGFRLAKNAGV